MPVPAAIRTVSARIATALTLVAIVPAAPEVARADEEPAAPTGPGVLCVDTPNAPLAVAELEERVRATVVGPDDERAAGQSSSELLARVHERIRAGALPIAALTGFRKARELSRTGWRAFVAADIDIAREHLQDARDVARGLLGLQGGTQVYAQISLRLGAVLMQQGHREQALTALATARALDPERSVTLADFAPDVVDAYLALAEVEGGSTTLKISTRPGGAQVVIDGRALGPAPVSAAVGAGSHIVVAGEPGFHSDGRIVATSADSGEITVALDLRAEPYASAALALSLPLRAGIAQDRLEPALTGLFQYGGGRPLLMVASVWRTDQPALVGQLCGGVPTVCTGVLETRYPGADALDPAIAELWSRLTSARRTQAPTLASESRFWPKRQRAHKLERRARPKPTRSRCRLCRNPWLWAGVGAVLATTGTALWVTRDRSFTPVITVDPCAFGGCERLR